MTDDLALIRAAAEEAGALAVKLKAAGLTTNWKTGGSPVTNGDLAVDVLLNQRLRGARPDYGWLSEETADDLAGRQAARRTFVIDPIDGTTAYAKGRAWWSISIAIVEAGRPTEGVVYAPDLEELYDASLGGGARLNGNTVSVTGCSSLEGCSILGDAKMFAHPEWPIPWPQMDVQSRNSVAYRMAAVGGGIMDACIALSPKHDWDMAAGDLIVCEGGGKATDHKGRTFLYNQTVPRHPALVCAGPGLHQDLLDRIAHLDFTA